MYWHLTVKLLVGFTVLFFVARFIGGRELKKLNVFDFISAIVLSELVGNVLYQEDVNAVHMSYALIFWTLLIYLIDKIKLKAAKARQILDGEPGLVVEKGRINKEVLKKQRLDLNELLGLLREKGVFSLREVEYAFIEVNGNLSVMKAKQAAGNPDHPLLPAPLILDGYIISKSLDRIGRDREWVQQTIAEHGFDSVEQIFYAEYLEGQELLIQGQ